MSDHGEHTAGECPCGHHHDHADCLTELRNAFVGQHLDVTISTKPPVVLGPFTLAPFVCPHGVRYWAEPTGEQLAAWVTNRIP
jgi:hypothetical protein